MKLSDATTEALSYLVANEPFFATLLYDVMTIEESETAEDGIPTAMTDGRRIVVNRDWFGKLTLDERVFVLAHEVAHVIFDHLPRMKLYMDREFGPDLKKFQPKRWNQGTDYIINHWLHEIGLGKMPVQGLYNPNFTSNDLADDVYDQLPEEDDDDSDGPEGFDIHKPSDDQPSNTEVQRAVAGAASAAKAMGKLPAGIERIVGDILNPKISWQDKLRNAITATLGRDEATWSRPNRRKLALQPHPYLPGRQGRKSGTVAIQIDTSGSVSDEEMNAFRTEVAGILSECRPERTFLLWTDAVVAGVDEPEEPEDMEYLKPRGGGGTDMRAGITWLDKEGIVPDTFICLTDGYTPWPSKAPAYPTIWVSTSDQTSPVGTTIQLEL